MNYNQNLPPSAYSQAGQLQMAPPGGKTSFADKYSHFFSEDDRQFAQPNAAEKYFALGA